MGVLVIIMKNNNILVVKVFSIIITMFTLILGLPNNNYKTTETSNIIALNTMNEYNLEEDVVSFINENNDLFNFYSNMFGISISDLKESIINDNIDNKLNRNDIGNTNTNYDNLDLNLIDYLFNLRKTNNKLFQQEYVSSTEYSKDYIYGLINYFSKVYSNVDYDVLASIAYIESGNLNSKYMRNCNNIYGGMSSKGLIKYNNIELGVLSYVKMMSKYYYGKGLNTVELIAKKYNAGSISWIGKVNKYKSVFNNEDTINLNDLINLK